MFSYPLFPTGLQLGSVVALGAGDEVQVDVCDGPLVAVKVDVGGGTVALAVRVAVGVRVRVGVRVAVGVREAVGVEEGVCVEVGVGVGVEVAVPVSVGVAVSVGVGLSVAVSVGPEVAVAVLGSGEESWTSGAAVTVSRGRKVGSGVSEGGGWGLGGVGRNPAAIRPSISEFTGGSLTAVVEAYAAAAKVRPQIIGIVTRPTNSVDRQGCLRRACPGLTRTVRLGRVISSLLIGIAPDQIISLSFANQP